MPPFGKFDLDEQDENVAYDAEDSWQDVASYGTSESPSDFYNPPKDYNDMYVESEETPGMLRISKTLLVLTLMGVTSLSILLMSMRIMSIY